MENAKVPLRHLCLPHGLDTPTLRHGQHARIPTLRLTLSPNFSSICNEILGSERSQRGSGRGWALERPELSELNCQSDSDAEHQCLSDAVQSAARSSIAPEINNARIDDVVSSFGYVDMILGMERGLGDTRYELRSWPPSSDSLRNSTCAPQRR